MAPKISKAGFRCLAWIPFSFATTVVFMRAFVRTKMRNAGAEDVFMALCWITYAAAVCVSEAELDETNMDEAMREAIAEDTIGITSISLGKVSAILALLRLVDHVRRPRYFLQANLAVFSLLSVGTFFISALPYCSGPRENSPYTCWNYDPMINHGVLYAWTAHGAFLDIALSVLAMKTVHSLRMSTGKKAGLYAVLSLGWMAAPFSIIRCITTGWVFWLSVSLELSLIVICASVPTVIPLFRLWFAGQPLVPRAQAYHNSDAAYNPGPPAFTKLRSGHIVISDAEP